jgi:hypothetical protein
MTLIIHEMFFGSKQKLKQALDSGAVLEEPSVVAPWRKTAHTLPVGFSDLVTNGTKRTKFAQITKTAAGWEVK